MTRLFLLCCLVGCARAEPSTVDGNGATPTPDMGMRPIDARSVDAPTSGACGQPFTGVLASWDFAGEVGSQLATTVSATAAGVSAGNVSRSAALTAVSGASSINASNWPLALQRDLTKYYTVTLSAPSGCALQVTAIAVDAHASSTGPLMAVLATSNDNYGQTMPVSTTAPSTPVMSIATGMIEMRIYGYAASGTAGTLRLQNTLSITGSVQ